MSESEAGFIYGLQIIVGISAVVMVISERLFYKYLKPDEREALEKQLPMEFGSKVVILAIVNYISRFTLFINSAILVAVLLKGYL